MSTDEQSKKDEKNNQKRLERTNASFVGSQVQQAHDSLALKQPIKSLEIEQVNFN